MRVLRSFVVPVVAVVVLAASAVVLADGQVALVVGNSTYAHIGRLPNAENDAVDMSAALRRLGFDVTTELNADRVDLTEALRAFTRQSVGADIAPVFYAGHGIEMDGANYLVPVDARLERDLEVRYETVTVDDMLASTLGSSLPLVILDACRNNPLARSRKRTHERRQLRGPERVSARRRDARRRRPEKGVPPTRNGDCGHRALRRKSRYRTPLRTMSVHRAHIDKEIES